MPPARRCCLPAAWTSCRATSCRCRNGSNEPARHGTAKSPRIAPRAFFSTCCRKDLLGGGSRSGLRVRLGSRGGGDVFLDAGGLAFQAAQVIQLGATHLALALHRHRLDLLAV